MKKLFYTKIRYLVLVIPALIVLGTICEQVIQFYFNRQRPEAEHFCEIDGNQIHFVKKGHGGPTVVFQSGLGGDHKIWEQIQDSLSQLTTTISYDRIGLQWSDPSTQVKTLESIKNELFRLLEKTNCPKPYVLVGHSLAGITLRPFIRDYSKDISGIVLLDVSHPLDVKRSSDELKKYLRVPPLWLMTILVETGIARLFLTLQPFIQDLPKDHWMNRYIRDYLYRSYKTLLREAVDDDRMFEEAESIKSFFNIPLVVITGSYPDGAGFLTDPGLESEYLFIHRELQHDLLNLSTNSRQMMAFKSGHYVPLQDPAIVIDAVKDMLKTPTD